MSSRAQTLSEGQNHDRFPDDDSLASMIEPERGAGDDGLDITMGQKMVSAMSGSLVTSLLVTPLDVVRVRLQSQKPTPQRNLDFSRLATTTAKFSATNTADLGVTACCREVFFAGNNAEYCIAAPRIEGATVASGAALPADCAVEESQRRTYRSTLDGLRKIARNEGVTTLWRGLSPTLAMSVPGNIIYFSGYDWLRYNHKSPFSKLSDEYAPLTGGSVARVLAAVAVGPIELVRTRMQAASHSSTTNHLAESFKDIREMVGSYGYTSLWRGLNLTLWRDVPFSGLYWWGYEMIRSKLTQLRDAERGRAVSTQREATVDIRRRAMSRESHTETFLDSFVAGATSGAFASVVTTPFDVGKTRTQVFKHAKAEPATAGSGSGSSAATPRAKAPEEGNMVRLLWHIFKTEGAQGLWRGWIPRTLKVAPACAIMISSYEVGKRVFRGVNERASNKQEEKL